MWSHISLLKASLFACAFHIHLCGYFFHSTKNFRELQDNHIIYFLISIADIFLDVFLTIFITDANIYSQHCAFLFQFQGQQNGETKVMFLQFLSPFQQCE